jgi:hypothetical protein
MIGDEDPDPSGPQLRNDALDLEHGDWIDSCKRLIQQMNAGLMARLLAISTRRLSPTGTRLRAMCVMPNSSRSSRAALAFGERGSSSQNAEQVLFDRELAEDRRLLRSG